MNLLDLLDSVGGQQSLGNIASNLGLDAPKANDLVGALAPALMGGLKKQTSSQNGLDGLKNALQSGKHQAYLNQPETMVSQETVQDGNNILSSEGYKSKSGCTNGIESVRKNSQDPDRFVKTETATGKFRFALTAKNSQKIGTSQNYKSESGRNNGIKSVAKNAADAVVVEV